ncbi:lysoplasmalogenase [Mycolicibacillus trivialis]|nr:lysoplasmalogenase [Mycolicibacillus trivialis]
MATPYGGLRIRLWGSAALAAAGYGAFLVATALRLPAGAELTGQFPGQPWVKAAMALLLAAAAATHPRARERRWLLAALLFCAAGDGLLAIPWWPPSFVGGLGAFLLGHLCYLVVLVPLAAPSRPRLAAAALLAAASTALLIAFWPHLGADGLTVPVTVYVAVLAAMAIAAVLAGLPTLWTAAGAVLFTVSDSMIGIDRFLLGSEALALPVWWCYAAAQLAITAGLLFGRPALSAPPGRPTG